MRQLDDQLGHVIGRSGLAGNDHRARRPVSSIHTIGVGNDGLVARHHVQDVEQLPLVFVDALDLHIEQAGRVDDDAQLTPDQIGQALLVGGLDGEELLAETDVGGQRRQRLDLGQIFAPS